MSPIDSAQSSADGRPMAAGSKVADALVILACVSALAVSLWVGLLNMTIEPWIDEFWTMALIRPGITPQVLLDRLLSDAHPYLYFILAMGGERLGLSTIQDLRWLNLLGFGLVLAPLYATVKVRDLDWRAGLLILVLATSSRLFLAYLPELRPYCFTYCAALGLAVVWMAYVRRALLGQAFPAYLAILWITLLAALANLQYFGCLVGALLAATLLLTLALRRAWKLAAGLAIGSALVALPAVAMAVIQMSGSIAGDMDWITTTPEDAGWMVVRMLLFAGFINLPAFLIAVGGLVVGLRARAWADVLPALGLIAITSMFLAGVLTVNLYKPWLVDRYLIAAAATLVVALAALAGSPVLYRAAPRIAPALPILICFFAGWLTLVGDIHGYVARTGWLPSATAAKAALQACPTTRVYSTPHFFGRPVGEAYGRLFADAKIYGHAYYQHRLGFQATVLAPGQGVAPIGRCPAVVWVEHMPKDLVPPFFQALPIPVGATKSLRFEPRSGALIFVWPAGAAPVHDSLTRGR